MPLDWDNLPDEFTVDILRRLPMRDVIELERVFEGESSKATFTERQRQTFEEARDRMPLRSTMKELRASQKRLDRLNDEVRRALNDTGTVKKITEAWNEAAKRDMGSAARAYLNLMPASSLPKIDPQVLYPVLNRALDEQRKSLARLDALGPVSVPSPEDVATESESTDEVAEAYRQATKQLDSRIDELVKLSHLQVASGDAVADVLTADRSERDRLKVVAWLLTVVVIFQAALDSFNSEESLNVARALFAAVIVWVLAKGISHLRASCRTPKHDSTGSRPRSSSTSSAPPGTPRGRPASTR